jgi:hypothetical protein
VSDPRHVPPRPRSLRHLEAEIATQERARERCVEQADVLDATGRDSRQARAMQSIVEERLDRSREVLLRGEDDG